MLRRISAGIIDVLLVIFALFVLTVAIFEPLANVMFNIVDNASRISEIKKDLAITYSMGYQGDKEFIFFTDNNDFIEYKIEQYKKENGIEVIDDQKRDELGNTYKSEYESNSTSYEQKLNEDNEYLELSKKQRFADYFIFISTTFIGELFFLFIIPFYLIKGQTLGMKLQGLYLTDKNNVVATFKRGVMYFGIAFFIETVLAYTILGLDIIIFVPLINLLILLFNREKQTLHGLISGIKIVESGMQPVYKDYSEINEPN